MYYVNYNDYELLYLVSEGSEQAFNLLCHKYNIYINKVVGKINIPMYTKDDLVQECLIKLVDCINRYNPDYNKSFFSYFSFIMHQAIYRLIKTSYYQSSISIEDGILFDLSPRESTMISIYRKMLDKHDDIDLMIFDECLVEGLSISRFAKKHNLEYSKIYYRYKCIREELKKY